jgi:alpha,alpha-trehalase
MAAGALWGALVLSSCQQPQQATAKAVPPVKADLYKPDTAFPELFAAVQTQMIFADSKTFVDASPKQNPGEIAALYQSEKSKQHFALKAFVEQHFDLPPPLPVTRVAQETDMKSHLQNHWANLVRDPQKTASYSTLIPLPHPYVVPGGRFREMFYWDTYFTMLGLLRSGQDELARGMIDNFAYLIDTYGYIPNGNRSYFLTRSQPPFFALMLNAYAVNHGAQSVQQYLPQLEREYKFWMDGQGAQVASGYQGQHLIMSAQGDLLNRYYGNANKPRTEAYNKELGWAQALPEAERNGFYNNLLAACESGWDFSSRWFADGKTKTTINALDLIPVDLSSLLYVMEKTLGDMHGQAQHIKEADFYSKRAVQRKNMIAKYHYDQVTGTYQDYNFATGKRTGQLTAAMLFPLYVGAATPEAAASVATFVEQKLLKPGGVVTSLTASGEQWDFPNGWAPLQFIAVQGLLNYQHEKLGLEIARRWLALNEKVYASDGKMMEKYNVVDTEVKAGGGNYPNQDGFGWTNGVDLVFYDLLASRAQR